MEAPEPILFETPDEYKEESTVSLESNKNNIFEIILKNYSSHILTIYYFYFIIC